MSKDWETARQMMRNHKSPGLVVRHLRRMLEDNTTEGILS